MRSKKARLVFAALVTSSLVLSVVGIALLLVVGFLIGDTYGSVWVTVYGIFIAICIVFGISYGMS
jgi:hypothetical protein